MRSRQIVKWGLAALATLVTLAGPTAWAADTTPAAATTEQTSAAPAAPAAVPAAPAPATEKALPFRLGLFFSQAFGQSGALTRYPFNREYPAPLAFGADIAIGIGSAVRYHLGVAHERESRGNYSAKGFRLDLVSLGFPISVFNNEKVALHVEPIARVIRGEILFPSGLFPGGNNNQGALFRVESGFAVAVTAAIQHWFVSVEPLALDIRSFSAFTAGDGGTATGYSRLWWFQITAGREF